MSKGEDEKKNDTKNDMKNDIEEWEKQVGLKYPSSRFALIIYLLATKDIPVDIVRLTNFSFAILIEYNKLKEVLDKIIKKEYPDTVTDIKGNKLFVYRQDKSGKLNKNIAIEIQRLIEQKYGVRVSIILPTHEEYVMVIELMPFAVEIMNKVTQQLKKKYVNFLRLFKMKRTEASIEGKYYYIQFVKYNQEDAESVEEMVKKL